VLVYKHKFRIIKISFIVRYKCDCQGEIRMINIKRLDHVQLCIPVGKEDEARSFYTVVLGLQEIPKPQSLISNGGLWFQAGDIQLHIGVEKMEIVKSKRHPAFEVEGLEEIRHVLEKKGVKIQDEKEIPNVNRFSFFDPFGNRIELLERVKLEESEHLTKQAVKAQFSRSADGYVKSQIHSKGADLRKLVEIADVSPEVVVLDVATGGGHVANALSTLVKRVIAYDLTQEMLDVAERFISGNGHSNVDFVRGDAEQMTFTDERFDLITCRIAPHHFPHIESFVQEVFRVLKPGGQFLLVDNVALEDDELDQFYNEIEKRRDYSHFRAWKKSEWIRMLEAQGFDIDQWYRFTKTFAFEDWCDRMHLSDDEKEGLSMSMLNASQKIKNKFRITAVNGQVLSFEGESIILKAIKP
jgi:ubiquinone/menaquinone biosynthesis C-methylase UbiE/catechol 2,3-dioxygenase-like lactoylglutathione lyase family enzyme